MKVHSDCIQPKEIEDLSACLGTRLKTIEAYAVHRGQNLPSYFHVVLA